MSDADQKILDLLSNDGRATIRGISEALDIPESTARDRIRSLEERNVISGYRVVVDPRRLGMRIIAWATLEVPNDDIGNFAAFLDSQPQVLRGYQLSHRPNAFAVKLASSSSRQLTLTMQSWRAKFTFKTQDLILVDDPDLDPEDEEETHTGALDERLIA